MRPITLVCADDHPLVLAGVEATLAASENFLLLAQVRDGTATWEACQAHRPDLLLLDLGMPGLTTVELLDRLEATPGGPKVVILTSQSDLPYFHRIKSRIQGYLLKDEVGEELIYALRAVSSGTVWFTQKLAWQKASPASLADTMMAELTRRELQVLTCLGHGMDNYMIGEHLGVAEQTVRNYVSTINDKLGFKSRTDALLWARDQGLLKNMPRPASAVDLYGPERKRLDRKARDRQNPSFSAADPVTCRPVGGDG